MSVKDAVELGTAIITSLGGGGAIVFGLSNYLGKVWADRALEQERHKYADILQTAKSELDKATNRYQVELDSLSLAHKLRMTEEFLHLGQLWKHMAILQDTLNATAGLGLQVVPADQELNKKYKEALRHDYEATLIETRKFFLEEKLFIPANIAECADATLGAAIKEKNFYDIFSKHHEGTVREQYTQNLEGFVKGFNDCMKSLEKLMREHIEGKKLGNLTTVGI